MKNQTIKILALVLIISVSLSFMSAPAVAAGMAEMVLSRSPAFPGSIVLQGQTITVRSIPSSANFLYLWLRINCAYSGDEVYSHFAKRDGSGSAVFDIALPGGRYNLELFHSGERYSTYRAIFYGTNLQLDWRGGSGEFIQPQMYTHNSRISRGKREDIAALLYYLMPSHNIQSDHPDIRRLALQITAGTASDYDSAMAIHDWVCDNIYYNYDEYYLRSPFSGSSALRVLSSKTGVCEGYANLTAALLRAAGIPAKKILGYAQGVGEWPRGFDPNVRNNHAWNEAYVDGRWVIMDATWNSDNDFEYGRFTNSGGLRGHRYFDVSPMLFSATHAINGYNESGIDRFVRLNVTTASPFTGNLRVDNAHSLTVGLYNIGGNNYMMLRDATAMLGIAGYGVDVRWNDAERKISINTGLEYLSAGNALSSANARASAPATLPAVEVSYNGQKVFLMAYSVNGSTYFMLRDLGSLFGFGISYDAPTRTVNVDLSPLRFGAIA